MNIAVTTFAGALRPLQDEDAVRESLPALWKILDAAVRRWAPIALDEAGNGTEATALRQLPEMTAETLAAVYEAINWMPGEFPQSFESAQLATMEARYLLPFHRHTYRYVQSTVRWAAECANYAGEQARAEARALVDELTIGLEDRKGR